MKILFAAKEDSWGGFLHEIRKRLPQHRFDATGGFFVESLRGYDVLIPTMCRITRDTLATADRLRLIQQCGAGIEGVDLKAALEKNIYVANVPTDSSGNADSVAELGIYLMLGLSRRFRSMEESFRDGRMGEPQGISLSGKTAGIVGLGGIGKALIRHLKGFDMRLLGIRRHDPQLACEELGLDWSGGPNDLDDLLRRSDYVILCVPLSDATTHLINLKTISAMKKGAFLINLARGGLVDRSALEEALRNGMIAGAGLDVFWEEPPDLEDPIFQYNVLATPHIAGSTDVSMLGIVNAVTNNIELIGRGEKPHFLKLPG
jgi:phosphoglycerate dehydrogenase-like enzyme